MALAAGELFPKQPPERHLQAVPEQTPLEINQEPVVDLAAGFNKLKPLIPHPSSPGEFKPHIGPIAEAPLSSIAFENDLNAIRDSDLAAVPADVEVKLPTDETMVLKTTKEIAGDVARVIMLAVWSPDDEEVLHIGAMRKVLDTDGSLISRESVTMIKDSDIDAKTPDWLIEAVRAAKADIRQKAA